MAIEKVIVIDDEPIIRRSLELQLRGKRLSVALCSTIAEAEKYIAKDSFDLMFVDVRLPDVTERLVIYNPIGLLDNRFGRAPGSIDEQYKNTLGATFQSIRAGLMRYVAHNPAAWTGDALFRPATRESFQSLLGLGLTDALRAVTDAPGQYTFWDYQAGAWQKNHGLRIDHLLLSPQASDGLVNVGIDSYVRAWEKPSDHVPVWIDLDLEAAA